MFYNLFDDIFLSDEGIEYLIMWYDHNITKVIILYINR